MEAEFQLSVGPECGNGGVVTSWRGGMRSWYKGEARRDAGCGGASGQGGLALPWRMTCAEQIMASSDDRDHTLAPPPPSRLWSADKANRSACRRSPRPPPRPARR